MFVDNDLVECYCIGVSDYCCDGCMDIWGWVVDMINVGIGDVNMFLCLINFFDGFEKLNDLLGGDIMDNKDGLFVLCFLDGVCGVVLDGNVILGIGMVIGFWMIDVFIIE